MEATPVEGSDARVIGTNDYTDTAGLRRRGHHRRHRAQAGHEPRRPAEDELQDREGVHGEGAEALARTPSSSWSRTRSTRCARWPTRSRACPSTACSAWRACSTARACAPSSPWSSASRSRTCTPSCWAATATPWCRCRATRPWRACPSPSCMSPERVDAHLQAHRQRRRRDRRAAQDRLGLLRAVGVDRRDGGRGAEGQAQDPAVAAATSRASSASRTSTSACPRSSARKGVEKIWEIKLTDAERTALHKSAAAVKELVDVLKI